MTTGPALILAAALVAAAAVAGAAARGRAAVLVAADTAIVSRSVAFFEDRLARDPGNPAVGAALVGRYVQRFQTGADLRDLARAESLALALLPLTADTAAAWARLSGLYLMRHEFTAAYAAARRAVASDAADPDAQGALFDAALAGGRYAVAESTLARLRPASFDYQVRLAYWLDAQGLGRGAAATLARVCARLAAGAQPPHAVAWCRTELGGMAPDPAVAAAQYHEALAALPGYRAALEGLADLAYAAGAWRRAERLYARIAVDAHPDLYLRLAEIRAARGDTAGARRWEAAFLRAATAPDVEPLYAHPLALFYAGRPATSERAIAIARRDVARRPAAESWEVLSWTLYRAGRFAEALAAGDSARARLPASATGEAQRALILRASGRRGEGDSLLARAAADPALLAPHLRRALADEGR